MFGIPIVFGDTAECCVSFPLPNLDKAVEIWVVENMTPDSSMPKKPSEVGDKALQASFSHHEALLIGAVHVSECLLSRCDDGPDSCHCVPPFLSFSVPSSYNLLSS